MQIYSVMSGHRELMGLTGWSLLVNVICSCPKKPDISTNGLICGLMPFHTCANAEFRASGTSSTCSTQEGPWNTDLTEIPSICTWEETKSFWTQLKVRPVCVKGEADFKS